MGKLQVRRGNKIDMPNPLDNGELGWATDTEQLYMGTGVANKNVFIGGSPATDDYKVYLATSALGGRAVSAGASGLKIENGTTTSASASKLVNANAAFTDALVDKTVYNSSDGTWAKVTAVDSPTQLSISADIMGTGEAYDIADALSDLAEAYSIVPATYGVNISIVVSPGTFTYAGAVTLGGKTASGNVALSLTGSSTTIESTTTTTLTFGDDITISGITFGDSVITNGVVTFTTCPITGSLTSNGTLATLTNSDIGGALTAIGSVVLDSTDVTGAVDVAGDFTNTNGISVGGAFTVDGACSLDTAAITGNTITNSTLTNTVSLDVTGDLTTNGVADVVNVSVGDDLITNDNFTCATDLDVTGDLTANGVTTVEGTITVGGAFVLNGSWIQTDSLDVTGNFTAYGEVICSNVTVGGILETRENFTQTGTLAVTGAWNSYGISTCQDITITGQAEFFGKLYLTGTTNIFNGKVLYHERFEVLNATFNKSVYSMFGGDGIWDTCTITDPYKLYVYSGSANRMVSGTYTIGNDPQNVTNIGATVTKGYTMYVASSTLGGTAGADGLEITSGTGTGTTANKLVDSNAAFTEAEHLGKTVYNSTDDTWAKIDAVDDANTLSLSADIMASGEAYSVVDAISTMAMAWSNIPGNYNCDTTIKTSAETYTENLVAQGKTPAGPYTIYVTGTMIVSLSTTGTGGTQGQTTGATRGTVVKTSAGWTAHAYQNKLIQFASDTTTAALRNRQYVIQDNTADTITIYGAFQGTPANGDTFKVLSWTNGTVLTGASGLLALSVQAGQKSVVMKNMTLTSAGTDCCKIIEGSSVAFDGCYFDKRVRSTQGTMYCMSCYGVYASNNFFQLGNNSFAEFSYSYLVGGGGYSIIYILNQSSGYFNGGTTLDGVSKPSGSKGVNLSRCSTFALTRNRLYVPANSESGGDGYILNCATGAYAAYHCWYNGNGLVTYTNCTATATADTATYGIVNT